MNIKFHGDERLIGLLDLIIHGHEHPGPSVGAQALDLILKYRNDIVCTLGNRSINSFISYGRIMKNIPLIICDFLLFLNRTQLLLIGRHRKLEILLGKLGR